MTGAFVGLTSDELQILRTDFVACLRAIALNQAYSMSGRLFTRADLTAVTATLGEINYALNLLSGSTVRTTYAKLDV